MSVTEYQPIVEAINNLQSNPVKDYLFPVLTLVGSAVLGVGASIYTNNFQDTINAERHKLKMLNNTTLAVAEMRDNLVTIKSIYHGELGNDPIQRLLAIPPLANSISIPKFEAAELTFLTQIVGKDEKFNNKWIRVEIIKSFFSNYKSLIEQWGLVAKHKIQILNVLAPHYTQGRAIAIADLLQHVDRTTLIQVTDLIEKVLMLTDELIIEFSCFLIGFPSSVQNLITKSVKKKYGGILQYQLPTHKSGSEMLEQVPPFDKRMMADIQCITLEQVNERYRYVYS